MLGQPKPVLNVSENGGVEIYSDADKQKAMLEMIDRVRYLSEKRNSSDITVEAQEELDAQIAEIKEHYEIINRTLSK